MRDKEAGLFDSATLSQNLKELRLAAGLSQSEIAKELGVSQNSIWKYESGKAEPSLKAILWYSRRFDITVDEMLKKKRIKKENVL